MSSLLISSLFSPHLSLQLLLLVVIWLIIINNCALVLCDQNLTVDWPLYSLFRSFVFCAFSQVPMFVQVQQKWRRMYTGECQGPGVRTDFEMVHLRKVPSQYNRLSGLLDIFKSKIVSIVKQDAAGMIMINMIDLTWNMTQLRLLMCALSNHFMTQQFHLQDSWYSSYILWVNALVYLMLFKQKDHFFFLQIGLREY